jgi:hypothetical protein
MGKQLLAEIRTLRYTGSLTDLQRLLNGWRRTHSRRRSERQRLSLPLRFRISSCDPAWKNDPRKRGIGVQD